MKNLLIKVCYYTYLRIYIGSKINVDDNRSETKKNRGRKMATNVYGFEKENIISKCFVSRIRRYVFILTFRNVHRLQ